jgi:micrococcal nuclease
MKRGIAVVLGSAFVALSGWAQMSPVLTGVVTAVTEGDTIKVQLSSGPILVRLANIDAPEPKQPGAQESRLALDARLVGEQVSLNVVSMERDGPVVAVVHLGEENVNAWMVKQGHAWAYRPDADSADYCVWENAARSLRRGLWGGVFWLAPWEWRQRESNRKSEMTDFTEETTARCIAAMK